jgi:hypothetical protein
MEYSALNKIPRLSVPAWDFASTIQFGLVLLIEGNCINCLTDVCSFPNNRGDYYSIYLGREFGLSFAPFMCIHCRLWDVTFRYICMSRYLWRLFSSCEFVDILTNTISSSLFLLRIYIKIRSLAWQAQQLPLTISSNATSKISPLSLHVLHLRTKYPKGICHNNI